MTALWTSGEGLPRDAYDEIIDRVFDWAVEQESVVQCDRTHARELFEELMRHPPARQHLLVTNSLRFRNWALCEVLLEESQTAGFEEPVRATELARLAVAVAGALPAELCGESEVWNGLRARAWAQLGNAHRISSDHLEADRAFAQVAPCCAQGRIGLLDLARVLDLEASLRRDQRRFAEASRLLDRVILIYERLGQWNLLGRALKQKSMVCGEAGDLEAEIGLLRRALDLLDPKEEPLTFLAARHNLISALNQSGRSREAFSLLFHTRPLYLQLGGRMNLLRMRWLEGLVAQGLERKEQAEVAFREVRQAFIELGDDYDAALASLDLASILILQGRTADLRQLAEEMLAVFTSRNIHREALAALLFFCHAARMEQAKEELVRDVAGYLKRARNDPELRFTPSA
jgi:tetratricopeptide (TPR) repeat protein